MAYGSHDGVRLSRRMWKIVITTVSQRTDSRPSVVRAVRCRGSRTPSWGNWSGQGRGPVRSEAGLGPTRGLRCSLGGNRGGPAANGGLRPTLIVDLPSAREGGGASPPHFCPENTARFMVPSPWEPAAPNPDPPLTPPMSLCTTPDRPPTPYNPADLPCPRGPSLSLSGLYGSHDGVWLSRRTAGNRWRIVSL
jgi:hypothetical protein